MDIGGSMFTRNSTGLGSLFSSLRFYCFKKQMFNNITYSFGEKKELNIETNYLFAKQNLLVDYMYKNNANIGVDSHNFYLYKDLAPDMKGNIGFTLDGYGKNHLIHLSGKKYIGQNTSFEINTSFFIKYGCIKSKLKQKLSSNIFTISKQKIEFNEIYPKYYSKNSIIYKLKNKFFKLGYFHNLDGFGLEIG